MPTGRVAAEQHRAAEAGVAPDAHHARVCDASNVTAGESDFRCRARPAMILAAWSPSLQSMACSSLLILRAALGLRFTEPDPSGSVRPA